MAYLLAQFVFVTLVVRSRKSITEWYRHFISIIILSNPQQDDSILVLHDHYFHTRNVNNDMAHRSSVTLVSLLPQSAHKMQPLDVIFINSSKNLLHPGYWSVADGSSRSYYALLSCNIVGKILCMFNHRRSYNELVSKDVFFIQPSGFRHHECATNTDDDAFEFKKNTQHCFHAI